MACQVTLIVPVGAWCERRGSRHNEHGLAILIIILSGVLAERVPRRLAVGERWFTIGAPVCPGTRVRISGALCWLHAPHGTTNLVRSRNHAGPLPRLCHGIPSRARRPQGRARAGALRCLFRGLRRRRSARRPRPAHPPRGGGRSAARSAKDPRARTLGREGPEP